MARRDGASRAAQLPLPEIGLHWLGGCCNCTRVMFRRPSRRSRAASEGREGATLTRGPDFTPRDSLHVTPSIVLIRWSFTGGTAILITLLPSAMSSGARPDRKAKPFNDGQEASSMLDRRVEQKIEITGKPRRPWNARASAPMTTNSTRSAISNAQNSSKSGARSNVLIPEELDGGNPLCRRA